MKRIKPILALVFACILIFGAAGATSASTSDVASGIMGDANGDGKISVIDVTLIMRQIANLNTVTYQQTIIEDVNHDGSLTGADVTLLLRYLLHNDALCETVIQKTTKDGLYSFTAQDNASTIDAYLGAATVIRPFPVAMEGHIVTAITAGAFTNSGVTEVWFAGTPIEGLAASGLSSTCEIHYPAGQGWETAGLDTYFTNVQSYQAVAITVSDTSCTYDGSTHGVTVSVSPAVSYTISYVNAEGQTVTPVNAGEYAYTIELTQSGYAAMKNDSGTLTIEKANYSAPIFVGATVHRANDEGEEQHRLFATSIPQGVSVTYVYYKSTAPTVPLSTDYASDVGTYYVYANYTHSNPNYNQLAKQGATLVIKSPWSEGWMSDLPQG